MVSKLKNEVFWLHYAVYFCLTESNVKKTLTNIRKKVNQSPRNKQLVSLISRILT